MKSYPVGAAVTVTIPFVDMNGDPVKPTGLRLDVTDQNEVLVAELTPTFQPDDTEIELRLEPSLNAAAGLRTIKLEMTEEGGGMHVATVYYVIAPAVPLVLFQNSFQTYSQAVYEASQMLPSLTWDNASEQDRIVALVTAYDLLTRFGYRIAREEQVDAQSYLTGTWDRVIKPINWPQMTNDIWIQLPDRFKRALRRAQIAQACELISGDLVAKKRRQGLLSETIGESSMMFRTGKPLDIGLSKDVLSYLGSYLDFRITLTRS